MERRDFLRRIGLAGAASAVPAGSLFAEEDGYLAGTVKGQVTDGKRGISGAIVSDGYSVVAGDSSGKYNFVLHPDADFMRIVVPSGYDIPHEKGISRCYKPLEKGAKIQTVNFVLNKSTMDDTKHALIIWADPQIRRDIDAVTFAKVSAVDTANHIKTLGNVPVHGIAVGDLVHDRFDLFDEYAVGAEKTGVPFFQMVGNHDMNYTARSDKQSQDGFKSLFGPQYYSFNRGKIHYVVLDDVFYIGQGRDFVGYLPEEQMSWLEKDLKHVPTGSTVFINMHIPSNTGEKDRLKLTEDAKDNVLMNREHLYKILKPYTVHFMTGHTHWNESWERDNMIEHNHGTVCGTWWSPQNLNLDGTPNGYGVYMIDGSDVTWHYKSVGFPKEYQMKVYPVGRCTDKPLSVVANVWNFDTKWKVEWIEDGVPKGNMVQFTAEDPDCTGFKPSYKRITAHLFAATPSAGAKSGIVRATDRFGKVYEEKVKVS